MEVIGYCRKSNKDYVAFTDQSCGENSFKVTDGFHDKVIGKGSDKESEIRWVDRLDVDLERITKRIRGARPWHPLLKALRKEMEKK